jgi:hypothetical protein
MNMGYRSEVCVAVYGDALALAAHLARWRAKTTQGGQTDEWVVNAEHPDNTPELYRLEFSEVKWYEGYTDVAHVMSLLEGLDEGENPALCGEFVRTGEEDGDFDTKEYGDQDRCEGRYRVLCSIQFD